MNISPDQLCQITGGILTGTAGKNITSISTDSRTVRRGGLFVALKGAHVDGHEYLKQAFERGAHLAMVANPGESEGALLVVPDPLTALGQIGAFYRGLFKGRVGAITGSNGKTVLKSILHRALAGTIPVATTRGSYNSRLGVPLALLELPLDRALWIAEAGVSELGDMALIEPVIRPDFGILTNIGLAHLAGFGTREAIAREKLQLFERIPPDGWVLLPRSEPLLWPLAKKLRCRVYWYGEERQENHTQGLPSLERLEEMGDSLSLLFAFPKEAHTRELRLNTPSKEIARDVELAVAAASILGVTPGRILERLREYEGSETRMEIWRSPGEVLFINDACSSDPISVESALRSLKRLSTGGRRVFLFGGMGELGRESREQHEQVGRLAAQHGVQLLMVPRGRSSTPPPSLLKREGEPMSSDTPRRRGSFTSCSGVSGQGTRCSSRGPVRGPSRGWRHDSTRL